MKRGFLLFLVLALCGTAVAAAQDPAVEVARVLDEWTSFRWGQDCLVWVVHYPQELVDPWIRVEGSRQGLSPYEMETSAQSFRKSLRMDEAEAFLLSVYNFGGRPLRIAPVEGRLLLELPDGRRVGPLSFEERLAQPIEGLVQGLVFFPRQEGTFSLVLVGIGPGPETRFSFAGAKEKDSEAPVEELVVELPPLSQEPPAEPEPPLPPQRAQVPEEPVSELPVTPVSPDFAPPPPFLLLPSDPLPQRLQAEVPAAPESPIVAPPVEEVQESPSEASSLPHSREALLERFIQLWIAGDADGLYALLSDESKRRIAPEEFRKDALSRSFRLSLKDGYRTTWLDENRVKITAAQKLVFIRILQSETLHLVHQEGGWRVAW